jgi:O-antigen ligase/Tfp pilus assembly protein PilF
MDKNKSLTGGYFTLYFYFLLFFLPVVFIQKCEDAYYLPKLILLAGAGQLMVPVIAGLKKIKVDIVDLSAAAFIIIYAFGFIKTSAPFLGFMRWIEWFGVISVFLYARHFLGPQEIKKAVILMLSSAFVVSAYAFIQVVNVDFPGWITNFSGRVFSSLGNPDFLGGFLVLIIPFALYAGYEYKSKLAFPFLFLFFVMVLVLSQTRSSLAAFAIGLIMLIIFFPGYFKSNYKILAAGLIIAVLVIIFAGRAGNLFGRLISAAAPDNLDLHGRYSMWSSGIEMIRSSPLLGIGLGGIKRGFCLYYNGHGYFETEHLHNDFIEIFAESGIFSFIAFMMMLGSFAFMLIKKKNGLALATLAAFAAMMVQAFFNFPFFVADSKLYFFATAGLALNSGSTDYTPTRKVLAPAAVIAALPVVILLMVLSASIYLNSGINSMLTGDDRKAAEELTKSVSYYYDRRPALHLSELGVKYKNFQAAESYAVSYFEKSPCSKEAAIQYSIVLAETGRLIESLNPLDNFLSRYPDDTDVSVNKGRVLYMLGRTAQAVAVYKRIIEIHPDNESAHNNIYGIYSNSGMKAEAAQELMRWDNFKIGVK